MKIPFISQIVRFVGIDLGSSQVRIWTDRSGFAIDEPALIAFDAKTKRILAVGSEAAEMRGRVSKNVVVEQPIQDGKIYDLETARALLRVFLQKVLSSTNLISPVYMCSVPAKSSEADLQAVTRLMYNLGAREVYTISSPLAASIGADVPIADASGCFILHLGADVVEGAVISLGSMVHYESTHYAGNFLSKRLQYLMKKEFALDISLQTAEEMKRRVVSAYGLKERKMLVTGKSAHDGSPKEISVTAADVAPELLKLLEKYEKVLRQLLSTIPPELTVDVIDKGLLLAGGLANIDGVSQYFVEKMGIPVSVVDNPEQVVIKGTSIALEHLDLFKESLGYQS